MMSRLWQWLAAAGAAVVAGLYALIHIRTRQRDSARDEAIRQRQARDALAAAREREGRIREAQAQARDQAEIEREERHADHAAGRRRDLGNRRLRDD